MLTEKNSKEIWQENIFYELSEELIKFFKYQCARNNLLILSIPNILFESMKLLCGRL